MHEAVRNLGRVCLSCTKVGAGEGGGSIVNIPKQEPVFRSQ